MKKTHIKMSIRRIVEGYFTIAISILTILLIFSGSFSPEKSDLMNFITEFTPFILFFDLLLLIYSIIRKAKIGFLLLISVAFNYNYFQGVFNLKEAPKKELNTINIASYNVYGFRFEPRGYYVKQIAQMMKEEKVDIICFQEFNKTKSFTLDSIISVFSNKGWTYHYTPEIHNFKKLHVAIFSKYPILKKKFLNYKESANSASWCDIQLPNQIIRVFNCHLQTTQNYLYKDKFSKYSANTLMNSFHKNTIIQNKKRAEQVKMLLTEIEETKSPIILCGDLNATPASYTYHQLRTVLKDGFQTAGNGYEYTYLGLCNLLRIDYIFHSKNINVHRYYSKRTRISDHKPVFIQLQNK